jgi:sugar phosphate isomerase/epimerase
VKYFIISLLTAGFIYASDAPLYVFDNGTGRGVLSLDEQAELAKRTGYAGIFYSGTKDIPGLVAAHKSRGLKVLGIYTGINVSDPSTSFDPGLPEAIRQLKGTGALITFTVNGKTPDGDAVALPILQQVCDMAAVAGLKVALYPHYGFHVATVQDALRLRALANRPNLGLVFNLCHWLRAGDEPNLALRLQQAIPHTFMVSINGADHEGDWDRLIQPLGRGSFDVKAFLHALHVAGYRGPIGLQCYNVQGDREQNLIQSMKAWRTF